MPPSTRPHRHDPAPPRPPTLGAVVLAAGASRRLGQAKQAVCYRGVPLVAAAAGLARAAATGPCVVVTGANEEATVRALRGHGVRTVHNPRWATGMASSLRTGLDALGEVGAMLVLLCDQWAVGPGDVERLVHAWAAEPERIAAARWAAAGGPPAVFPATCFAELRRLEGDRGARALLAARGDEILWVDMPAAAFELDDDGDLATLRSAEAAG